MADKLIVVENGAGGCAGPSDKGKENRNLSADQQEQWLWAAKSYR
jgi:hypothetical protein